MDPALKLVPAVPLSITVALEKRYGQEVIIPVCDKARVFAEIARTKELTRPTIDMIKRLGYRVEVVQDKPKEL